MLYSRFRTSIQMKTLSRVRSAGLLSRRHVKFSYEGVRTLSTAYDQVVDSSDFSQITSFIDGEAIHDASSKSYLNRTPISSAVLGEVKVPTEQLVNSAIESSHDAFSSWSKLSSKERGSILYKAAEALEDEKTMKRLCSLECIDAGLPIAQVMDGHLRPAVDCLKYYASLAMSSSDGMIGTGRVVDTPDIGGGPDSFCFTRREPLGVCAGIGPWNYPLSILMWKLAPALACGNTFVFKPSECTPVTAVKLAELFLQAGLPPGVFNVLTGDRSTGSLLTKHKLVSKVSFTGSTQTGIQISRDAAATLKKMTMELGGKSPIVIFEDCDLDNAVGAAMMANFINNGQACSNGTRVLVQNSVKEAFIRKFVARTKKLIVGNPLLDSVNIGPLMMPPDNNAAHFDRVRGYVDRALTHDVHRVALACGGEIAKVTIEMDNMKFLNGSRGYYLQPTILACSSSNLEIMQDEIFGPVACVLGFDNEEEAIALANATDYGLAAGVMTRDIGRAHRVAKAFQAGTVWINNFNLAPSEAPFGPYKMSGHGKELGTEALHSYTQTKSIYVETGKVDSSWFPF